MNSLYSGKQQLFEKLDKMVSNKNDETEISLLIDSLRVKTFLFRKKKLTYLYSSDSELLEKRELTLLISSLSKSSSLLFQSI